MENKNICQRLHAIMADVGYVQKENKKVNNQYTFVSHDAVTAKMRPAFLEHGVMVIPSYFDISQDGNRTHCSVSITFVNIDTPEDRITIPCAGFGQGIDPQDKGAGKAMSYAYKYALLKVFGLETGDDPESESIDHKPKEAKKPVSVEELVTRLTTAVNNKKTHNDLLNWERDTKVVEVRYNLLKQSAAQAKALDDLIKQKYESFNVDNYNPVACQDVV